MFSWVAFANTLSAAISQEKVLRFVFGALYVVCHAQKQAIYADNHYIYKVAGSIGDQTVGHAGINGKTRKQSTLLLNRKEC